MPSVKYTRYLYDLAHCQCMVFKSILDKDHTQILFWVCEIFFSGFHHELLELAYILYMSYYVENHPTYASFLKQQYTNSLNKSIEDECMHYCNMFINMMYLTPSFFEMPPITKKRRIYIMTRLHDIEQFCTTLPDVDTLKTKCVYRVDLDHCASMDGADLEIEVPTLTLEHQINWLKYCVETPYWLDCFSAYNGRVVNGDVVFESEQDMEEFYEHYGYDPDEQPNDVHLNRGFISH